MLVFVLFRSSLYVTWVFGDGVWIGGADDGDDMCVCMYDCLCLSPRGARVPIPMGGSVVWDGLYACIQCSMLGTSCGVDGVLRLLCVLDDRFSW